MVLNCSKLSGRRRGAVVPWLVLSLGVIVGMVALGMDGGRLMEERRHGQAVADAAALAAAANLYQAWGTNQGLDPSGTARSAALTIAAANGYANDSSTSVVTVNIPPASGAFAQQSGYAEVLVQYNLPRTFAGIFSSQNLPVKARAVAVGQPVKIGLTALSPTGAGALTASGTTTVTVQNGPVIVNSSNAAALTQTGGVISAGYYQITGGVSSSAVMLGPVYTGVPPSADPLQTLAAPNPASFTVQSNSQLAISGVKILYPGTYRGGLAVSGNGTTVTLMPGIYILDGGGLNVSGGASVSGAGVMIYNTTITQNAGPITVSGGSGLSLTPPASGTYQGVTIFQDRAVNQTVSLSGGSAMNVSGVIYTPDAALSVSGNAGGTALLGGFIANTISISGSAAININVGNNPPNVPNVTLVE